jgi:hypothetical protein
MQVLEEKERKVQDVFSDHRCEKIETCDWASPECHQPLFATELICHPRRRWMYCYAWKQKLGMVFDKDLGVYILPEWKKTLMERAKTNERLVKAPDGTDLPITAPNDVADFMEKLGKEIVKEKAKQ